MLKIKVAIGAESYDEVSNEFVNSDYFTLELEHSLASLSKWESEYEKPFLGDAEKTAEETLFYVQHCMTLTENPPEEIFQKLSTENFLAIQKYINAKRTAETFHEPPGRPGGVRPVTTAKVIYGWLVALRIPFEVQYWHLNEVFTLVKVCNAQSKPPVKMSRAEAARQQAALNAKRRAEMGSGG